MYRKRKQLRTGRPTGKVGDTVPQAREKTCVTKNAGLDCVVLRQSLAPGPRFKTAKPGDRFDVQVSPDGKVTLTPLVPKNDDDVPVVKPVRTKEGFLMFPPGKGPSREQIVGAIREDRDLYQNADRSLRPRRRGR